MAAEALPDILTEPEPVVVDVREQEPVVEEAQVTAADVASEAIFVETTPESDRGDFDVTEITPGTTPTTTTSDTPIGTVTPTPEDTADEDTTTPEDEEVESESAPLSQQNPNGSTTQIVQIESLVSEENYYQFSKQSCIAVGDGAYHCTNKEATDIDTQSVVYSAAGTDGSLEIFLKTTKGKVRQITDNIYDDTSSNYDPESMRVVYQRLVDGRYQIVVYNIMEEKETQLTFSKTNNMEPKVSDSGIVWQAWDGNDWEVMLFDGMYTEQLTDNLVQDVVPVIQDGYVLWNVLGGTEQQARVYSLDTKETTSIQGYEGGSIINPRFVLVYDTEYDNGDVVTQSFDPSTGLSEPIAAKPAPTPVNIPENDPTGEIRALINSGKTQKDEKELPDVNAGNGSDGPLQASSTPGTLDLKAQSDNVDTLIATPATHEPFELTEYDLVIPQGALETALQSTQE